ncbi:UNVERIFIED_CONTAM: hypothetical protein GTU68_015138, partial [Idotea baltica]|nr:hypothetical protein [Idotea baltica]
MPGWKAKQLVSSIIFASSENYGLQKVSNHIREIFSDYTDIIEPLSLDEAFLDVTVNKKSMPYGMDVALEIMERVKNETQLTCSAGVSYCKFLAKVASDFKKPYGLTVIRPQHAEAFLEALPVKDFFGVGKVTAKKMAMMGISTGKDLKQFSKLELAQRFGKSGMFFYDIVRGIDDRPVNNSRIRKSLGIERTLNEDLSTIEEIYPVLQKLIEGFITRLAKADNYGRTITLKLKSSDFQTITRSSSKKYFIKKNEEITQISTGLLEDNKASFDKIRLIGLTASNL